MSQDITKRRVMYELPEEDAVAVRQDVEFRGADGEPLVLDVYALPGAVERPPAVVMIHGFPDPGYVKMLGSRFKDIQSSVSWGRLLAASGLACVTYTNREPIGDLAALFAHLSSDAASMGIDGRRIGVLATSGHGSLGLSTLMQGGPAQVACGAFLYPYTLDLDGATGVAEMSKKFGFVNACAGLTSDNLRTDAPIFVARAGRDGLPHLNVSLDRLVAQALARNLPVTLVNHAEGVHAFDLMDPGERSKAIVKQLLGFFRQHLLGD
jgi:hypothetical protein